MALECANCHVGKGVSEVLYEHEEELDNIRYYLTAATGRQTTTADAVAYALRLASMVVTEGK